MRTARVERKTKESHVLVELNLDGQGIIDVATGVPFFDHMMSQLGKHSGFNLTVKTTGDIDVDSHHTVEDTSLAFGQALREALGDKAGIRRFGDSMVPLDEVLVQEAVDLLRAEPRLFFELGREEPVVTVLAHLVAQQKSPNRPVLGPIGPSVFQVV